MRNIFFILLAAAMWGCGAKVDVAYDLPLDEALAQARDERKPLVVVLSRPDCPPCATLVQRLESGRVGENVGTGVNGGGNGGAGGAIPRALYNIVDVQQPENAWYTQWLCLGSFPTVCLFGETGELKAVISGGNRAALECLGQSIGGKTKCAEYYFGNSFAVLGNKIDVLNEVLACKRGLDKGEDMAAALDEVLKRCDYPYPVWLKIQNEIKQGRDASALAERIGQFTDPRYLACYSDILQQAKYIANPDYNPDDEAVLTLPAEIRLADCTVGEPCEFDIEISNDGKMPLVVNDIQLSCTCLELLTDKTLTLAPGAIATVRVAFTAESAGEFYREVLFFSDAAEKLMRMPIRAVAKSA